jgi:spore germination protein YaaH
MNYFYKELVLMDTSFGMMKRIVVPHAARWTAVDMENAPCHPIVVAWQIVYVNLRMQVFTVNSMAVKQAVIIMVFVTPQGTMNIVTITVNFKKKLCVCVTRFTQGWWIH